MALVKPIAQSMSAFDATTERVFRFTVNGGTQVVGNILTILSQITNQIVYQDKVETYSFVHSLPKDTLNNGEYYVFYFQTYDVNGNVSEESNRIQFVCLDTPQFIFTNPPKQNVIESNRYTFYTEYNQKQSEKINNVKYYLYDDFENILSESELYSNGSNTLPMRFSHSFNGFENNGIYKVEAIATTINGLRISTGKLPFVAKYYYPKSFSLLDATNNCETNCVKVSSNVIIADGYINPRYPLQELWQIYNNLQVSQFSSEHSNYTPYLNNFNDEFCIEWDSLHQYENEDTMSISKWTSTLLDLRAKDNYVEWTKGFTIKPNFTITLFMKMGIVGEFVQLGEENNGYVCSLVREIPQGQKKEKDCIELRGYINGELKVLQRSNYVDILNQLSYYVVWIRKNGDDYELILDVIYRDEEEIDWIKYIDVSQYAMWDKSFRLDSEYNLTANNFIDYDASTFEGNSGYLDMEDPSIDDGYYYEDFPLLTGDFYDDKLSITKSSKYGYVLVNGYDANGEEYVWSMKTIDKIKSLPNNTKMKVKLFPTNNLQIVDYDKCIDETQLGHYFYNTSGRLTFGSGNLGTEEKYECKANTTVKCTVDCEGAKTTLYVVYYDSNGKVLNNETQSASTEYTYEKVIENDGYVSFFINVAQNYQQYLTCTFYVNYNISDDESLLDKYRDKVKLRMWDYKNDNIDIYYDNDVFIIDKNKYDPKTTIYTLITDSDIRYVDFYLCPMLIGAEYDNLESDSEYFRPNYYNFLQKDVNDYVYVDEETNARVTLSKKNDSVTQELYYNIKPSALNFSKKPSLMFGDASDLNLLNNGTKLKLYINGAHTINQYVYDVPNTDGHKIILSEEEYIDLFENHIVKEINVIDKTGQFKMPFSYETNNIDYKIYGSYSYYYESNIRTNNVQLTKNSFVISKKVVPLSNANAILSLKVNYRDIIQDEDLFEIYNEATEETRTLIIDKNKYYTSFEIVVDEIYNDNTFVPSFGGSSYLPSMPTLPNVKFFPLLCFEEDIIPIGGTILNNNRYRQLSKIIPSSNVVSTIIGLWNNRYLNNPNNNTEFERTTILTWEEENPIIGVPIKYLNDNMDEIFPLTKVKLSSGLYDYLDISSDVTSKYIYGNTSLNEWSYDTRLQCDFKDNVRGGNIDIKFIDLKYIRLKRRKRGTFDWITIKQKKIETYDDLIIVLEDYYVPSNYEAEYALVTVMEGDIEGRYITTPINSKFNGFTIADKNNVFTLKAEITYGGTIKNSPIGTYQPLSGQFPILQKNSDLDYYSGSVNIKLLGYNFEKNRVFDRFDISKQTDELCTFLNDMNAKIIKDWNGNIHLVRFMGSPNIAYDDSSGNAITTVTANWVEQGKFDNQDDLINNGLI